MRCLLSCLILVFAVPAAADGLKFHGSFVEDWEGQAPASSTTAEPVPKSAPVAAEPEAAPVPPLRASRPVYRYVYPAYPVVPRPRADLCFDLNVRGEGFAFRLGTPCRVYRTPRPYRREAWERDKIYKPRPKGALLSPAR